MEFYLIRHTTPDVEQGVIYGQLDLDVTGTFHREAEIIRRRIPGSPEAIWSSPLKRCRKLAVHLFNQHEKTFDERLKELDFGQWEGRRWDDINPNELDTWMKNFVYEGPPGGESMMQLRDRVAGFLDDVKEQNREQAVIVTHAGVIRIIYSIIKNKPLESVFELKLEYGAIIRCDPENAVFEMIQ